MNIGYNNGSFGAASTTYSNDTIPLNWGAGMTKSDVQPIYYNSSSPYTRTYLNDLNPISLGEPNNNNDPSDYIGGINNMNRQPNNIGCHD